MLVSAPSPGTDLPRMIFVQFFNFCLAVCIMFTQFPNVLVFVLSLIWKGG